MAHPATSWNLIRRAADGDSGARGDFTERFLPVVRAYLAARWRGSPLLADVEDAVQDVFLDCFREGGVLQRVECRADRGFRAFLFGVVQKAALRVETRRAAERGRRTQSSFHASRHADRDGDSAREFDRAWARAIMRDAAARLAERSAGRGDAAGRRVELLRLRFQQGLPIREIAARWGEDARAVHREYARARVEFRDALRDVIGLHERCSPERVEEECAELLGMLQ